MILYNGFKNGLELIDYCNKRKLTKENIIAIVEKNDSFWVFWEE